MGLALSEKAVEVFTFVSAVGAFTIGLVVVALVLTVLLLLIRELITTRHEEYKRKHVARAERDIDWLMVHEDDL